MQGAPETFGVIWVFVSALLGSKTSVSTVFSRGFFWKWRVEASASHLYAPSTTSSKKPETALSLFLTELDSVYRGICYSVIVFSNLDVESRLSRPSIVISRESKEFGFRKRKKICLII